ncbi:hypothetical protein ES319_A10G105700v1 [Gossypium barbadense]|uniref:Uncharacterized protein n=2 Tax=Gossypium TaxID=3633 RepID=A0A5J5U160_GOSBA|nr:hypothetical protein ES319_A10G105700v1 [Gossypium barbadense]KAB2061728.1 hypothetical protein ES319_A10G105700v1 [Gossypium barbadense]KAB2061729.1 hypothetical protein ES319_A10G105700v1 [Gossypium barbadense]TYG98415.1 hypothetical protein ES288_A10G115800v1 [Gossypium darwinii]
MAILKVSLSLLDFLQASAGIIDEAALGKNFNILFSDFVCFSIIVCNKLSLFFPTSF